MPSVFGDDTRGVDTRQRGHESTKVTHSMVLCVGLLAWTTDRCSNKDAGKREQAQTHDNDHQDFPMTYILSGAKRSDSIRYQPKHDKTTDRLPSNHKTKRDKTLPFDTIHNEPKQYKAIQFQLAQTPRTNMRRRRRRR